MIGRFCRKLRPLINKYFTAYKTTRYIGVLDKLVDNYNNTFHSTLKTTPNNVINDQERINMIYLLKYEKAT